MNFIVDTSVAVKWIDPKNEKHVSQAENLLDMAISGQIKLFSPDLIVYELLNALRKGKKTPSLQMKSDLSLFLNLPLVIIPYYENLLSEAARIAEDYQLTIYDATFLALAKINNATLVTENLKDQGRVKEVKVLNITGFSSSTG